MTFLCLMIIALMLDKPVSAAFAILNGLLVMAMYQFGGDRLRAKLRRFFNHRSIASERRRESDALSGLEKMKNRLPL